MTGIQKEILVACYAENNAGKISIEAIQDYINKNAPCSINGNDPIINYDIKLDGNEDFYGYETEEFFWVVCKNGNRLVFWK
jgi:hypothetical protein